jgi:hypothetical protein
MISSFTTVVGVVIAFCFGGSALTQMRRQIRDSDVSGKSARSPGQAASETKPEEKTVRNG